MQPDLETQQASLLRFIAPSPYTFYEAFYQLNYTSFLMGSSITETFKALSGKEKKVLELIINGLSNSGIAKELTISVKTVDTHRANIMKKLEIHNLVDLVKFSIRNGLA